ncbi:MAG TPA: MFS transporter [Candidatus Micrarchaeia archaeon]|nr:MFS transporter [Candidatus Micrarchaeia archaeon]
MTKAAIPSWREVFHGRQGRLLVGLVGLETVGAIEALVAVTAMPAAARSLGHLALYGWVFAVPGLATVAAIPVAARDVDRAGARRSLAAMVVLLGGGTVLAGAAPDIGWLLAGRLLQGLGTGAQYAVGLGLIVRELPVAHRARAFAILAGAWVLPGMVGPAAGGVLAATVGWRWAFWAFLPLVGIGTLLVWPLVGGRPRRSEAAAATSLRWSVQVAVAGALVLGGITALTVWTVPLLALGSLLGLPAISRLSGGGQTAAPRELRLALAMIACLSVAFFAVNSFLPLLLTRVREEGLIVASLTITGSTLGWAGGSWWQSRAVARWSARRLVAGGAAAVAAGTLGVTLVLLGAPPWIADGAWTVAGLGVGVAYPTVYLVATRASRTAAASTTAGLVMLMDTLGAAAGAGLAGSGVALSTQAGRGIATGLVAVFGIAAAAALAVVALARVTAPGRAA